MIADLGKFPKNYFALGLCPLPLLSRGGKKYILTYTKKLYLYKMNSRRSSNYWFYQPFLQLIFVIYRI